MSGKCINCKIMGVWDDVKQVFDEMTSKEKLYVGVILFVVIAFVVACIIFPISVVILATIVILGIVGFLYTENKSLDKELEEDRAYYASDSACVERCGSYRTKKASYDVYKDGRGRCYVMSNGLFDDELKRVISSSSYKLRIKGESATSKFYRLYVL